MAEQNQNLKHDEIEGIDDPQIMELVAYLDGELPDQDADRVEQLLQSNAPLRRDAETLDRTWQLLDSLEAATASGEFTKKTLSTISAIADDEVENARRLSFKKMLPGTLVAKGLVWCLAGFLACSTGLLLSREVRRDRTNPADKEILNNLDLYLKYPKLWRIPDVKYLKDVSSSAESTADGDNP